MTSKANPRHAALISSGSPVSLKVLYCLHRLGLKTDLIDIGAPGITRFSRYRQGYARFSGSPPTAEDSAGQGQFAAWLNDYIDTHAIDIVIGADIGASAALYRIGPALSDVAVFPVASPETLEMLDDKWLFHQFLSEHDIPCPAAILLEDAQVPDSAALSELVFPVMVKPLHGESGHGIVRAECVGDIESLLRSGDKYARPPLMIQSYVPGYDADLSVLAKAGQVVTHVLQSRHDSGALAFIHNEKVLEIGRRIVEAADYTGVANIDMRIDEASGAVRVLECNPRFWYTLQASLWRGLNFVEAGIDLANGGSGAREAPVGGTYHLHGDLMKRRLWTPHYWGRIPLYNLRGLLQALSDPAPFIRPILQR